VIAAAVDPCFTDNEATQEQFSLSGITDLSKSQKICNLNSQKKKYFFRILRTKDA